MADNSYQPKVYTQQGGDRGVVASGGSFDVESGGEIDIESGGALKLAGTALTDGAILNEATANVTMGAGYLGALTAAKGIQVTNTGSAATTGTSITFRILYTVA